MSPGWTNLKIPFNWNYFSRSLAWSACWSGQCSRRDSTGKRISTWLVELGQLSELPDPDTLPINGRIALARIEDAMGARGERATEIILDRTEGKLKPEDKPDEEKGEPMEIIITHVDGTHKPKVMTAADYLRGGPLPSVESS